MLDEKRARAELGGGGEKRIAQQHAKGKLTARERIRLLLDDDSFEEWDKFRRAPQQRLRHGEAEDSRRWRGYRLRHHQRPAGVRVQPGLHGLRRGAFSEAHAEKICKVMDQAMKVGAPVIGLNDSGGARIQEGVASLGGYAEIFQRNVLASGVVPADLGHHGALRGGAVYSPAITDFIFMVEDSAYMFVTGPGVVKTVTHEEVTPEELGGSSVHTIKSGVADLALPNDVEAMLFTRRFFDYLPPNNREGAPRWPTEDAPRPHRAIPRLPGARRPGEALRHQGSDPQGRRRGRVLRTAAGLCPRTSSSASCACRARSTVGVVANQPMVLAGCLDIDASKKGARFVRFCDAFNIPIFTLVDVPGFMPAPPRSTAASSPTAPSCCTPTRSAPCRR